MDIGKRIKARRKELGLSAEEVAERMGVSAATVYRYESNYISNMGVDKLTPIATALKTSEAYLMGWTNNKSEIDNPSDLTDAEQQLLEKYRKLNPEGRAKLLDYAIDLVVGGRYA
ncbi:XRE family transcriptional regulator [Anaerotruncus sp. 80]|uniref:XRE family transcriptional regulator n=1 Tax=Anaerotruncus colihominis TaxID=169435 RepID=A0A845QKJ1_9FIRM|nr:MULTISPECIES: helix-turn-helix transcriptional regulator [Anaerotruncus]NBH61601.1 XRE family transcriptional regulator [Anaerotruncus colihominis]NCF02256.1 XRE family transcriptional regulator [Anaerotruncus sp. 80]